MLYKYRAFVIRSFSSWQTIFPYAPKFSHITPILRALHWFMINERIEYKLLSLTYKVLTTSPAEYLVSSLKISSFVELVRESLNGTTPSNQLNIYLRFWVVINFWTSRQWKGVTSEDRKNWPLLERKMSTSMSSFIVTHDVKHTVERCSDRNWL